MNKLTPEQLVILNQKVSGNNMDAALRVKFDELVNLSDIPYRKNKELFYEYKTTLQMAAKLGNLIAIRKPFKLSNRETAALALLTLLDINGIKMIDYGKDVNALYDCLEDPDIGNICKWIEAHKEQDGYINSNRID